MLELRAVSYAYDNQFVALDEVSLTIEQGERVALLGANGCGKSTLLKVLDGLLFPATGSYRAFGIDINESALDDEQVNRAFRGRVGFVFQNSDVQVFSPCVRDEVAFGPLSLGLAATEVRERVDDVLAMLGIAELADRPPYLLSGGEKKRVAIASVLSMNPEVLLFDEPTAALDPRTQQWLLDLLVTLADAGKTIVVASHELAMLPLIAGRGVVFAEDHRVVADAPIDAVLADRELVVGVNLLAPTSRLTRSGARRPPATEPTAGGSAGEQRRPRPAARRTAAR